MFTKTVLDNGIRILSEEMPNARSVSLGIWVENGSRHEARHQNGISHFIEHLLFKGTDRRSAAQIAEEMDSVGGVLNAFTAKEHTCYYAKVLDENFPVAIDLLTDIFLHSVFDREEIERERSVILQEISQAEDTPDDYVHDLFNLDLFKDHPLGRPICGQAATVLKFSREDFLNFVRDRYLPGRVIVAASGHVSHEKLVREMDQRLGGKNLEFRIQNSEFRIGDSPKLQSGIFQHSKPLEQVHLCIGVAGTHQTHPLRYAAYILNTILGGGMSSRLFQEIREKRGKAYSIYSFLASYRDVGYLGVYAGTSLEWAEEVVDLIVREMGRLAAGEIGEEELQRAKSQLVGNMILGLESTDSWMSHITRNEIYFGKAISVEEISSGVRSVSRADIVDLARATFRSEEMALSLLGDFEKKSLDLSLSI
ncbi:insulinase family protein [candidate division TA06 bacterium]|nr:insulinase family protein [candidate division TA06 bacterium]MCZ6623570.1 pitrilysin family protein [Deltaproteobacteria bacterium]